MKKDENNSSKKESSKTDKMMDKAADTFNWWNKMATINKDDSIFVGFCKIILRVIGILFLLAISPFVILGLIVGMTAAL